MQFGLGIPLCGRGPVSGSAGISVIGVVSRSVLNSTTGAVLTFPEGTEEGDLAIVFQAAELSTTYTAPAAGYEFWLNGSPTNQPALGISRKFLAADETSITIDGIATANPGWDLAVIAIIVRGVDATTPLDVAMPTAVQGASATTITPPAITTANDSSLAIVFAGHDDWGSHTITAYPAGYANTTSQNTPGAAGISCIIGLATKMIETAGTETPGAFTFSLADANAAATIALRAA